MASRLQMKMQGKQQLPAFDRPPIIELALGVQFADLKGFHTGHFGAWRERVRTRFPQFEQHPPLPTIEEKFDLKPQKVTIQLVPGAPAPRCWFLNNAGTELIQLQQNRFVYNWRKQKDAAEYPRYTNLRRKFARELDAFSRFLRAEKLGPFAPNQCELTYIDHIVAGEGWQRHGQISEAISVLHTEHGEEFLPEPENANLLLRYIMRDHGKTPIGRLHASASSEYRIADFKPLFVLRLTARGRPLGNDIAGVVKFLDIAHEWSVRAFLSLTTERMHKIWGRTK